MTRTGFFLVLMLICIAASARAGDAASALYQSANKLYQEGKYADAANMYREARGAGLVHPDLYYNLGNAEFREGRLGPAIADYLRAQRLAPRDPDIAFNLAYARDRISGRIAPLKRGAILKAFDRAAASLAAREWITTLTGLYWLAALAAIVFILARRPIIRVTARRVLIGAALILVLALPFGAAQVKRDLFTPRAVIVVEKVMLRSGPDQDLPELVELREGMDVVVGKCDRGWCNLSASGGFAGWAPADSFERL